MDAIITIDADQRIMLFNPAAEAMFQCPRSTAIGQPIDGLIPDRFRSIHRGHIQDFTRTGITHRRMTALGEVTALRADGTEFPVEASISQVDIDGQKQFSVILRDITQRKRHDQFVAMQTRTAQLSADIGMALTRIATLREILQQCAEAFVQRLDVAFARVWTLNLAAKMLDLQASAGMYTHLDGPHGRVPVGKFMIGLIAQEKRPYQSDNVLEDPRVSDKEWARREGMIAFAGYPLMVGDNLVGVVAMFARQPLSPSALDAIASVSNQIALGIEHKLGEDALQAAQQRLQHVVASSPAVLFTLSLEHETPMPSWVSENVRGMLGFDAAEVLNPGWWASHVIEADRTETAAAIRGQLEAGGHAVVEYRIHHRNGTSHWIHSEKRLVRDSAGTPIEVIGSWSDITDRKLAEQKEQAARKRLQDVVASSPAVLFTLAYHDGQIRGISWMSENVYDLLGFLSQEIIGDQWWLESIHADDKDLVVAQVHRKLAESGRASNEYRLLRRDGSYCWVRDEIRLLRDPDGNPIEVVGSFYDITERKQLEEQYRQAQKMEAIGRLAGGIAHDFNNLLTIIIGYSDIYHARLRAEDPLRMPLAEIRKAGERAMGLTRQLLAFSRKQLLMLVVLDLNTIIAEMEKMLHRLIGEDVSLTVHPGADLWQVKADVGQIEQVIMNIIVNARDAMPRGGKILVETRNVDLDESYAQLHAEARPGKHVLIAISDTGTGMDASVKARIFEPFFTTKDPTHGTGLGLATVFGIVKQTGGHIEVYSEPGQGTTFKIYLPRDQSGDPVATAPRVKDPVRGGNETILLVEDEDGVRLLAKTVLAQSGYTVLDARHGGDALMICELSATPIHLMITDVVMPHFSGRELAARLATRQPNMKVLFMSGYTDDAIVHHGVLDSGVPFLQKPFSPDALMRKVREVLDSPKTPSLISPAR